MRRLRDGGRRLPDARPVPAADAAPRAGARVRRRRRASTSSRRSAASSASATSRPGPLVRSSYKAGEFFAAELVRAPTRAIMVNLERFRPRCADAPELLGIRLVEATPDRVVAEMERAISARCPARSTAARSWRSPTPRRLRHALNLPPGASTTTIESKTNFFARSAAGRSGRSRRRSTAASARWSGRRASSATAARRARHADAGGAPETARSDRADRRALRPGSRERRSSSPSSSAGGPIYRAFAAKETDEGVQERPPRRGRSRGGERRSSSSSATRAGTARS